MKYGNTKRCRSLLLGLAFTLGGGLATAQSIDPVVVTSMDIDLIQVPNQNRMAVKMRINNTDPVGYGGIVNTSFYIRWLTSSGATLGPRVNACTDGFNITNLTPVTDFGDGYTYRFYTSDNTGMYWDPNNHDDCLVPWFADGQWVTLFEIPVNNVSSCVEFQITNEGLAQQEGQEYYASAGGVELTGTVEPTVVQLGNCVVVDCPGLGLNIGDPCSDGDACTTGDAVTPSCECAGTFQDADGDLTCDANDGCPNDPNKVAAGVCGCGVADVDADSDGVYTCQGDLCDNDPLKTTPGACGCGVPDTDTDNDGTANCNDGCPNDPNKIAVGICGCGVADTDTDADGTADCVDPCPALANLENGDACDDGNPNTIGDVVTNCICAGSLPDDCEGVPGGPAQPGTGCDDNNACTINDLYDLNCNCAGTFQDTDSDGTCDANDGCPNDPNKIAAGICGCGVADTDTDADGTADCVDPCPALANLENGDACDDGNPNTTGDVVTNCICAGTLADDCEGVPGGPAQPGTSCDDNDACTINDVYDVNCNCAGTFQDTDGDLTCDANDGCPNDPDKIAAGICGCGVADTDTDADGMADCVDPCPALANLENGDACDDGNPNTTGDVVTNCICAGTLANDCEGVPGGPAQPGTSCDDNDACTINDLYDVNCNCAGTFEDTDGDGTCDANDGCPNDPDKVAAGICGCGIPDTDTDADGTADCVDPCPTLANLVNGDACDDGNPNTTGDVVTNCICAGTLANDCEGVPGGPAQPGTGCDDNDICTINDVYDVNCNCAGTFEDTDGDGTCDANDGCPTDPDKTSAGQCGCGTPDTDTDADGVADCVDACPELPGLTNGDACDDGNPNTSGDVVTNCICAGTLANDCEGTPGGPAQPGTPCDDDDACTINDLWDVNCNCAGTFEDTDGDTVCDANDGCPTDPDKIAAGVCGCGNPEPGTACDDGNAGTENDQIDANCQCVGTPLDVDCEGTPGGTALPGTACDDQNANTENDTWDNNCVCVGTPIWDCPDLQANIGDACDDGNANTEGDMVDANCECHGTQVYDCPDLQANIGDACDDGDNTTDNDVVDANCECHGTPEGPCSEDLLLAISLDGNPGEVTWTVWDDTENTVVESGGPYAAGQANTTVTEAFCVPVGCYHLEVSDSGNDGGSSYVLSDDSGRRIIDASMGSYSSTSEIGGPLAARSFCVPTWNNSVLANWCDRSAHDRQSPLYCNSQPGATGYTWWFFDPHGTYNRRVTTANPTIVPNSLYSFPIPNNLWLNMRVRPVMAGSNFGPACRIKMVPHGGQGGSRELLFDEATNVTMSLYPNPNRDGLVTVYMEGVDVSDATMIDIDVYDMVGKRVFAERTVAAEGIVNHRMDLGHDTGAGLYMVNVTIDGKRYTQRLVIQ